MNISSHLYNRKRLFYSIFVAYGDRQRCRDTVAVVGLQGLRVRLSDVTVNAGEGMAIIHRGRRTGAGAGSPGGMAG
jgi:hypothetical protein